MSPTAKATYGGTKLSTLSYTRDLADRTYSLLIAATIASSAAALIFDGRVSRKLPLVPSMALSSCALVIPGNTCCKFLKARFTNTEPAIDRPRAMPTS